MSGYGESPMMSLRRASLAMAIGAALTVVPVPSAFEEVEVPVYVYEPVIDHYSLTVRWEQRQVAAWTMRIPLTGGVEILA